MHFVYIGKEVTLYVVPATLHVMLIKGNLSRCCQLPLNPISVELAGCSSKSFQVSLGGLKLVFINCGELLIIIPQKNRREVKEVRTM